MRHERQPTKTSCGPTCVAILTRLPVAAVLRVLPAVRQTPARRRRRDHRTNVGEMRRLLAREGRRLGPRRAGWPGPSDLALLRIAHPLGRNWHYAVFSDGAVYDPARVSPKDAGVYRRAVPAERISHYVVTREEVGNV